MSFSIRTAIRAIVAPRHKLRSRPSVWYGGVEELRARGMGVRESGAFLLGQLAPPHRVVERFVFYDDLDPHCLDSGIIRFRGTAYGKLWDICEREHLTVVADVHTHPGPPNQSALDRDHPMIAQRGHLALIIPRYAQGDNSPRNLGLYEYVSHRNWVALSAIAHSLFYVGRWA